MVRVMMADEKVTIGRTGYMKGYMEYTYGKNRIRFDVDYCDNDYTLTTHNVSDDNRLSASIESIPRQEVAESEFDRLLRVHGMNLHPHVLRRHIESMEPGETICRVVNRETGKLEDED